jgi:murein DD-endopeptidase MepM/ murein hydrolase activator NlpD
VRARSRLRPFRLLPFRLLVIAVLVAACVAAARLGPAQPAVAAVALRTPVVAAAPPPAAATTLPTAIRALPARRSGEEVAVSVRVVTRMARITEAVARPQVATAPVAGAPVAFRWKLGGAVRERVVSAGPAGWATLRLPHAKSALVVHAAYRGAPPYAAARTTSVHVPAPEVSRSLRRSSIAPPTTESAPAASFVFPFLHPGLAQPPGSWSLDQGVDMFAYGDACGSSAVLVAVGNGVVIQEGISGFGPTAPVLQMTSGPFAGRNVYYGHTGRVYVPVGATVHAGQPIAEIGCGQVGYSAGPHLEIGVGVPGGPPCCPAMHQTASEIYRLLAATY